MSLPVWERGLKYCQNRIRMNYIWSLPVWERGLKYNLISE